MVEIDMGTVEIIRDFFKNWHNFFNLSKLQIALQFKKLKKVQLRNFLLRLSLMNVIYF